MAGPTMSVHGCQWRTRSETAELVPSDTTMGIRETLGYKRATKRGRRAAPPLLLLYKCASARETPTKHLSPPLNRHRHPTSSTRRDLIWHTDIGRGRGLETMHIVEQINLSLLLPLLRTAHRSSAQPTAPSLAGKRATTPGSPGNARKYSPISVSLPSAYCNGAKVCFRAVAAAHCLFDLAIHSQRRVVHPAACWWDPSGYRAYA